MVPTSRDRFAEHFGGNRKAVDVRELALIGAETERRIALDMLDRPVVLANREMNIGCGDVVLIVDERLLAVAFVAAVRHPEDLAGRRCIGVIGFEPLAERVGGTVERGGEGAHGRLRLRERGGECEVSGDGTHAVNSAPGASCGRSNVGQARFVPNRTATVMAIEVDGRRHAPGRADGIAANERTIACGAVGRGIERDEQGTLD